MLNERNAGRKPIVSYKDIEEIKSRNDAGESLASLAKEYGVSRQALYKRLRDSADKSVALDYYVDDILVSTINADYKSKSLAVVNYASELSKLPFAFDDNPKWQDYIDLLESAYLKIQGAGELGVLYVSDANSFSLNELVSASSPQNYFKRTDSNLEFVPTFVFSKKDILLNRTDTDGFQLKALSHNRKSFVKSQAIMAGVPMNDWAVEIIAADIARQLSIPCVEQHHCEFVYGSRHLRGVYSNNFELDGYCFISFESLLETKHLSSKEDYFISLDAHEKLKWCAQKLSEIGNIPYDKTVKYMIDLAVIDCLVGNVDRHTRNFGLFFNVNTAKFEIPLIFDNGMGLFEHDYYRDNYRNYEEAMNNVYVAPYSEDPFELLEILQEHFNIKKLYKDTIEIKYLDILDSANAKEYERRMSELWQSLG